MKRFASATQKHISTLIAAISGATDPIGPGVIVVVCDEITSDKISLSVLELPTEMLNGPMDGAEIFYGFSFNSAPIDVVLDTKNIAFIRDDEGSLMTISGKTINSPKMSVTIKVNSDAPDDAHTIQVFNTHNGEFASKKVPSNVLAIIKHD